MKQTKMIINDERPYILLFVYGLMRKEGSFYEKYLKNKSTFIGEYETPPDFSMYMHLRTPLITKGSSSIKGEVYKIRIYAVWQNILKLEVCDGNVANQEQECQLLELKTEQYGKIYMFWHPNYLGSASHLIKSGDFSRRHFIHQKKIQYDYIQ